MTRCVRPLDDAALSDMTKDNTPLKTTFHARLQVERLFSRTPSRPGNAHPIQRSHSEIDMTIAGAPRKRFEASVEKGGDAGGLTILFPSWLLPFGLLPRGKLRERTDSTHIG